jgi:hypothetical protein
MKRLLLFGILWVTLLTTAPVSAQRSNPGSDVARKGDAVIGNNTPGMMSVRHDEPSTSGKTATAGKPATASEFITVVGQVSRPGVYEFRQGIPEIADLIEAAGGLTPYSGHEIYLYRPRRGYLKLDLQTQADFPFQDGDIVIAETPIRYYRELGRSPSGGGLYELHPTTQIVLLNLHEQPILLTVPPRGARLSALLDLLNQGPEAMVGVQMISPPHSSHIPQESQFAPSLIPSGSIIVFDSRRIERESLPGLPRPEVVSARNNIRVVSRETATSQPRVGENPQAGRFEWRSNANETSLAAFEAPRAVANSRLELERKPSAGVETDLRTERSEPVVVAVESNEVAPAIKRAPRDNRTEARGAMLSSQQKGIVFGFVIVVSVYLIAVVGRRRQAGHNLVSVPAGPANLVRSFYSTLAERFLRSHPQPAPDLAPDSGLDLTSDEAAKIAGDAEPRTELAGVQPVAAPHEASPRTDRARPNSPSREAQLIAELAAKNAALNSLAPAIAPIAETVAKPASSDVDEEARSGEEPKRASQASADESLGETRPRREEPSNESQSPERQSVAQPMFPTIWERHLELPPAEIAPEIPVRESADGESVEAASPTPREPARTEPPVTQGPQRIAFDRIFFAVQKERQRESGES